MYVTVKTVYEFTTQKKTISQFRLELWMQRLPEINLLPIARANGINGLVHQEVTILAIDNTS